MPESAQMAKNKPIPPDDPHPIPPEKPEIDPEVRRLLRRAVHGLKRPIRQALDSARPSDPGSMMVTVHLGLAWWARFIADAEIALGDSE